MSHSPNVIEKEVERLYEEWASGLLRYGMGLTQNRELAQDALQETFLRYFVVRTKGQEIENPKAWLYQVLRNYIFDRLKEAGEKNKVGIDEVADQADQQYDPEETYIRSEALRNAERVMAPRELECLRLRVEGFGYNEIANILGIRSGTIGATLARALGKIEGLVKKPKKKGKEKM